MKLIDLIVAVAALIFSLILMFHTFGYDQTGGNIMIAPKLWSDFGAHIPLIRSFSLGDNFNKLASGQAPQSPLFPGEPIRYHFGFYSLVGLLERIGMPLDWALNLPSALGLTLLLITIYWLTKHLTRSRVWGLVAIILFLFNGSLSFLKFFELHPLSTNTLSEILTNGRFSSFGPWDGNPVSAFWNLNIYTNQRHLGLSFGMALLILVPILTQIAWHKNQRLIWGAFSGLLLGLLIFINQAAFLCVVLTLGWIFLIDKEWRAAIMVMGMVILPFAYLASHVLFPAGMPFWQVGYLAPKPLSILIFVKYWVFNLGLYTLTIPLGFLFASKSIKLRWIGPLVILFALPNLVQFSPDMINNHKFFNFWLILGIPITLLAFKKLWGLKQRILKLVARMIILSIWPFLVLSGVIDLPPIFNETKGGLPDVDKNPTAQFFVSSTPTSAVVLNSTWFYHPASLAGRAIYSGYSYFTWSYGYDKDAHERVQKAIYSAGSKDLVCQLLRLNNIDYVELNPNPENYITVNRNLWDFDFLAEFESEVNGARVYNVAENCY